MFLICFRIFASTEFDEFTNFILYRSSFVYIPIGQVKFRIFQKNSSQYSLYRNLEDGFEVMTVNTILN